MHKSHLIAKAKKYRDKLLPCIQASTLCGRRGVDVHFKHSTLCELVEILSAIADSKE